MTEESGTERQSKTLCAAQVSGVVGTETPPWPSSCCTTSFGTKVRTGLDHAEASARVNDSYTDIAEVGTRTRCLPAISATLRIDGKRDLSLLPESDLPTLEERCSLDLVCFFLSTRKGDWCLTFDLWGVNENVWRGTYSKHRCTWHLHQVGRFQRWTQDNLPVLFCMQLQVFIGPAVGLECGPHSETSGTWSEGHSLAETSCNQHRA